MIIEITNDPHSFIVFLTASMGIGYAFFNRQGFGLGKLAVLVFVGGPLFITAYERHHMVDVGLGLLVGFLHAKEMIVLKNQCHIVYVSPFICRRKLSTLFFFFM
ncbi:MAG: hypothetical protein ACJAYF_003286 [Arenicella sp.]|jgi:hypothetical protein